MGTKQVRRTVAAMMRRWEDDAARLGKLFATFEQAPEDSGADAEMLRNLETAIAYARQLLAHSDYGLQKARSAHR